MDVEKIKESQRKRRKEVKELERKLSLANGTIKLQLDRIVEQNRRLDVQQKIYDDLALRESELRRIIENYREIMAWQHKEDEE